MEFIHYKQKILLPGGDGGLDTPRQILYFTFYYILVQLGCQIYFIRNDLSAQQVISSFLPISKKLEKVSTDFEIIYESERTPQSARLARTCPFYSVQNPVIARYTGLYSLSIIYSTTHTNKETKQSHYCDLNEMKTSYFFLKAMLPNLILT